MTVESSRSSGYCSLDEELEDCFFTAKTTFFRNVQSKHPAKVNPMTTGAFRGGNKLPWSTRETGILPTPPPQAAEPCAGRVAGEGGGAAL